MSQFNVESELKILVETSLKFHKVQHRVLSGVLLAIALGFWYLLFTVPAKADPDEQKGQLIVLGISFLFLFGAFYFEGLGQKRSRNVRELIFNTPEDIAQIYSLPIAYFFIQAAAMHFITLDNQKHMIFVPSEARAAMLVNMIKKYVVLRNTPQ